MEHLKTDGGRERFLERNNFGIDFVYFVSFDIVRAMEAKERSKGPLGREYDFVVKQSMPRHLTTGREFVRSGIAVTAPEFYGYDANHYESRELATVPGVPFQCGYFVDKSHEPVLKFLERNGILQ
jgi:hypothetical protein